MSMFHIKPLNIPEYLFYILLFSIPFNLRYIFVSGETYIGGVFSYTQSLMFYGTDLLFILLIVSWVFWGEKKKPILDKWFQTTIAALLLWLVLGSFHVKPISLALFHVIKWIELLLLIWVTPRLGINLTRVLAVLFVASVSQAILGIIQFHVQHMVGLKILGEYVAPIGTSGLATIDTIHGKLVRAYGTFPHPNVLGAYLLIGLSAGLFFVSRETKKNLIDLGLAILVSCGTIVIAIGIFTSFSRAAWIASVLIFLIFALRLLYMKQFLKFSTVVLLLLVSCGTIVWHYKTPLTSRVGESFVQSKAIEQRIDFNKIGVNIYKTTPLTGVGAGNYINKVQERYNLEGWQYQPAHNIYLFLAVELGAVGIVLFLYILWMCLRFTWNKKSYFEYFTLLTIFFSFILISNFDHYFVTIQQGELMFFSLLGLMLVNNYPKDVNVSSN